MDMYDTGIAAPRPTDFEHTDSIPADFILFSSLENA
jgi:hypothetical protein